jgi:methylenetetrahydrofolate dehydrogenase (NADP+) / methenyltetrahydrofolate cyclohydrolase
MILLDGTTVSKKIASTLQARVERLGRAPRLVIIRVGTDPRSTVYINRKIAFGKKVGADVEVIEFPHDITTSDLMLRVVEHSNRIDVDGIIVQAPIPDTSSFMDIVDLIDPIKDVDGLCSKNLRRALERARRGKGSELSFRSPATARGVETLLNEYGIQLAGARVLVVGRSLIAGLSSALATLAHDATITVAHSGSKDLAKLAEVADIVILAVGVPKFFGTDLARPHHVVVDVGISAQEGGTIAGDADFAAISSIVRAISPVPGGAGPMTVVSLFQNLVDAAEERAALLS